MVPDPKQMAKQLFRVIKRNRMQNIGSWKIIGLYQGFIWAWLSLVFFIKGFGKKTERDGIEHLVNNLPDVGLFVDATTRHNIEKLSELEIRNMTRPNTPLVEAIALQNALASNDNKEILLRTLLVLYVVRCNLFHGDKAWTNYRDNKVMGIAAPLLLSIVAKLAEMN